MTLILGPALTNVTLHVEVHGAFHQMNRWWETDLLYDFVGKVGALAEEIRAGKSIQNILYKLHLKMTY